MARERVTIYRRDTGKLIETGLAAGGSAAWHSHRDAYVALCYHLPRKVTAASVAPLIDALHSVAAVVEEALESFVSDHEMEGTDVQYGAHIESLNTHTIIVLEPTSQPKQEAGVEKACHWL